MRVWVCEDNEERARAMAYMLRRDGFDVKLCPSVQDALDAIPKISNSDVVTLDSQMPYSRLDANSSLADDAGLRICTAIRCAGKGCGVLWFSANMMPPEVRAMGGLAVEARRDIPNVIRDILHPRLDGADAPPEVIEFARRIREAHRSNRDGGQFVALGVLQILCEGFLWKGDGGGSVGRDGDVGRALFINALANVKGTDDESVQSRLGFKLTDAADGIGEALEPGWFDAGVTFMETAFGPESRKGALPTALVTLSGGPEQREKLGLIYAKHETELVATLKRLAGPGDSDPFLLAARYVSELCRFLGGHRLRASVGGDTSVGFVARGHYGLQFLGLLHLDFSAHPLMQKRSSLNHTGLDNNLAPLFDRGVQAATEAVLRGIAPQTGYMDIRRRIARWDQAIRGEIRSNVKAIVASFDPLDAACTLLAERVPSCIWQWLQPLHAECVRAWLRLREWEAAVEEAIDAYDECVGKVRIGEASIGALRHQHRSLVDYYSGRDFFNFSGGA